MRVHPRRGPRGMRGRMRYILAEYLLWMPQFRLAWAVGNTADAEVPRQVYRPGSPGRYSKDRKRAPHDHDASRRYASRNALPVRARDAAESWGGRSNVGIEDTKEERLFRLHDARVSRKRLVDVARKRGWDARIDPWWHASGAKATRKRTTYSICRSIFDTDSCMNRHKLAIKLSDFESKSKYLFLTLSFSPAVSQIASTIHSLILDGTELDRHI